MSTLKKSKWLFAATTLVASLVSVPGANAVSPAAPAAPVAVKLALTTPAPTSVSGTAFTTKPVVTIQDANGATVTSNTSNVTVSITGGVGGVLLGNTSKNAVAGVATFDALGIRGIVGTIYTLTYKDGALTAATQTVAVTARSFRVAIVTPADGATSGSVFTTQPVVAIQDMQGNTEIAESGAVTVSITGGGDATLIGTPTVNAIAGVATFSGLGINGIPGVLYTLTYSQGTLVLARQAITLAEVVDVPVVDATATSNAPVAKSGKKSAHAKGTKKK